MRKLIIFIICLAILAGCNQSEQDKFEKPIGNPTAEGILSSNPDADIFQWNGIVYRNASDIEWVQSKELTTSELIGTISIQYEDGITFSDGMATKLPVGSEIFNPQNRGGILLVKLNGVELRYLGLVEG